MTIPSENLKPFLRELDELTKKYQIKINGCGCHGSPWLEFMEPEFELKEAETVIKPIKGYYAITNPMPDVSKLEWQDRS